MPFISSGISGPSVKPCIKQPQASYPTPPATPPFLPEASTPARDNAGPGPAPRRKLEPTSPSSIKRVPKTDIEAENMIEEDDGTLPEGYVGTHDTIRYYNLPQPPYECGLNGIHELVCKHWVCAPPSSPCGLNCRIPSLEMKAFRCQECSDFVLSVLNTELSDMQKQKIEAAMSVGQYIFVVGFCVEFVTNWGTQHGHQMHGVAETIICVLRSDYGRPCNIAIAPEPQKFYSIVEQVQMRKQYRAWKTFEEEHQAVRGMKRKETTTAPFPSDTPQRGAEVETETS